MRKNGIVNKYEYVKEKITMDNKEKALLCHKEWNGKLETVAKSKVKTREDLAIAYTPGVAEPCKVIAEDKTAAYTYTWKANTVAVVSDGSAVLGLGNIGPYAAMPVMEGKAVLFKEFGGVNAFPICWTPRIRKRSSARSSTSPPRSAASIWKTSALPAASRLKSV